MKRKGLLKASVAFMVILLLVTFFSRSALYFVTPKVLTANVPYGVMTEDGGELPLTALLPGDTVYIVHKMNSFSGEVLVIEKVRVEVVSRDRESVFIKGLSYNDTVVTDWDRELRDGMRVMLSVAGT